MKLTTFPPSSRINKYDSLDFSGNPIDSFRDLQTLPLLSHLNVSRTLIATFEGAQAQPSLQTLRISGAPIDKYETSPIMYVIVFGPQIRHVNGQGIPKIVRSVAERLRPFVLPYLREGWILMGINPIRLLHPKTNARKVLLCGKRVLVAPQPKLFETGDTDRHGSKKVNFKVPQSGPFIETQLVESPDEGVSFALDLFTQRAEIPNVNVPIPKQIPIAQKEYQELTFDEAVKVIMPDFEPCVPLDDISLSCGSSLASLLSSGLCDDPDSTENSSGEIVLSLLETTMNEAPRKKSRQGSPMASGKRPCLTSPLVGVENDLPIGPENCIVTAF
jgi:hypothetical protein